jgi:hypothetical protein
MGSIGRSKAEDKLPTFAIGTAILILVLLYEFERSKGIGFNERISFSASDIGEKMRTVLILRIADEAQEKQA